MTFYEVRMFGLGVPELLVILFIILLLFGAKKLPDLASGLGGAVNSFRKSMKGADDDGQPNAQPKVIDARSTGSAEAVPKTDTTKV